MPKLTFALDFKTRGLRSLALPIEIRRPNSTLVGRTLASQAIDLQPGHYFARATLPGGQQLLQSFEMTDQPLGLTLTPDPGDESPHEWEETSHFLRPSKPARYAEPPREADGGAGVAFGIPRGAANVAETAVRARFRLFAGHALKQSVPSGSAAAPEFSSKPATVNNFERGRLVQFRIDAKDRPLVAQLVEPRAPARNMTVPVAPFSHAVLVFSLRADGSCSMEAHPRDNAADLMLRYSASSSPAAGETARATMVKAEELLLRKNADPIAAAAAGVAILSCGDLEWLHDWTANLDHRFPWLPDGAAIHGEHLARLGKHREAAERFFEVPSRGLPLLAASLFFAIERLTWYAALTPDRAEGIDVVRAKDALDALRPLGLLVHRGRPVTSYPGLDPTRPDATPVADEDVPADSIDLAEWL